MQMKPGWKLLSVSTILALSVALTGCQRLGTANNSQSNATPPPPPPISNPQGLQKLNHIIFMAQENRSFDNYFGHLSAYWNANGIPQQPLDGLPANASNPAASGSATVRPFH